MAWRPYLAEARSSLRAFRIDVREDRDRLDRVLHDRGVERLIREFDRNGSEVGHRLVKRLRRHLDSVVAYGGGGTGQSIVAICLMERAQPRAQTSRLNVGRHMSERCIRLAHWKVRKGDGKETFAGMRGNDKVAP